MPSATPQVHHADRRDDTPQEVLGTPLADLKLLHGVRAFIEIVGVRFPGSFNGRVEEGCYCPFCEGPDSKSPSASINTEDALLNCHGKCGFGGDVIDAIAKKCGVDNAEATRTFREFCGHSDGQPPASKSKNVGRLMTPVPRDAGLPPVQGTNFAYRNTAGELLLVVVRGPSDKGLPWTFRSFPDGTSRWVSSLKGLTVRPLYGGQYLSDHDVVLFVEGEKTADHAHRLFGEQFAVITTVGGVGQVSNEHAFDGLKGKTVVVWPDHDGAGKKYASTVAEAALAAGARSVSTIQVPPKLPQKWDLADLDPSSELYRKDFGENEALSLIERELERDSFGETQLVRPDEEKNDAWPQFIPFSEFKPSPFPMKVLPEVLQEASVALSQHPRIDCCVPAMATLATIGAAAAPKVAVQIAGSRKPFHLNIGVVVVADPAVGKSAVINPVRDILGDALKSKATLMAPAVRSYEAKRQALEGRLDRAQKKASDSQHPLNETLEEIETIQLDLAKLKPVRPPNYIADDVTPEMLAKKMADNDGRVFVASGEAATFANLLGRYTDTRSGSASIVKIESALQGLTNERIQIERKSSEPIAVELSAVSLLIGMHPSTAASIVQVPDFVERGMLSRLHMVFPADLVRHQRWSDGNDRQGSLVAFAELIQILVDLPPASDAPHMIKTSAAATKLFASFFDESRQALGADGELRPIRAWGARAAEHAARLAGLLHIAERPNTFLTNEISGDTMERAITLVRGYLTDQAWVAHYGLACSPVEGEATYLAGRMVARMNELGRDSLTASEVLEAARRFRTRRELNPPLQKLVEHGIAQMDKIKTGGRPREEWRINPAWHA